MIKKWHDLAPEQREQIDRTYAATQFQQDRYLYQVTSSGTVLSRWKMSQKLPCEAEQSLDHVRLHALFGTEFSAHEHNYDNRF